MTAEQRTVIVPSDISALELECRYCHSRIRYAIEKVQTDRFRGQVQCPNCKEDLTQSADEGPELNRLVEFVEALRSLTGLETRTIIRLEVASLVREEM